MSVREFKILMYVDDNEIYHIYDSKTASVQEYSKESVDLIIESGEYIRYMKKRRRTGTCAVIYKVNPKRYIVVSPEGEHTFRTFNEIAGGMDSYFNVEVYDDSLKPLDGPIQQADIYMENLTYKDMYRSTSFDIEVDKVTGEASMVGCKSHQIDILRPYNFISKLDSYSFKGIKIDCFECHDNVKIIRDYAFCGCNIGRVVMHSDRIDIEKHAFDSATIGSLELTNCTHLLHDNTFFGASIGVLDLEFSKIGTLNYKAIKQIKSIDKLILPSRLPLLNIDELLDKVKAIEFHSKLPKIVCKSEALVTRITEDYASMKKGEKVVSLLSLESNT